MSELPMTRQSVEHVLRFFKDLGGLHDAKVMGISWMSKSAEFAISIDDLRANFAGLPEHGGPRRATLIFSQVRDITVSADAADSSPIRVFDVQCSEDRAVLLLSPGGRIELRYGGLFVESDPTNS